MIAPAWATIPHLWCWEALKRAQEPISAWEVADRVGWLPGTVLALLPALEAGGLVLRDGVAGYRVGPVDPFTGPGLEPQEDLPMAKKPVRRRRAPVNLTLPPDLLARVAEQARREHRSVSRVVEDLLARWTAAPMRWSADDVARYHVHVTEDQGT